MKFISTHAYIVMPGHLRYLSALGTFGTLIIQQSLCTCTYINYNEY